MDDSGSPLWGFMIVLLLLAAEAILFCFRAAVRYLGEDPEEEPEESRSDKLNHILQLQETMQKLGNEVFFISILSNLASGVYLSSIVFPMLSQRSGIYFVPDGVLHNLLFLLTLMVMVCVLFVFTVYLPGLFGAHKPYPWAMRLYQPARLCMSLLKPFFAAAVTIANFIARCFHIDPSKIQEDVTEEEIISMVNEGHEQGVLEASEAEMIHNIFEFGDKEAQDIMTHRKHIVAVDGNQPLSAALRFMLEANNSRFPVYEGDIDNITGIIHSKDAMRSVTLENYGDWLVKDVPDLLRPAVFIPETRNIDVLFQNMQAKKLQMVMVADEYGQTAGLIAMEDILEEIVGNIQDEYDEEEPMIEKISETCYIMSGMTPLEDVEETLGEELPTEAEVETLNGFLITKLDKIPDPDEHSVILCGAYSFRILSVEGKTIGKVQVDKMQAETDEEHPFQDK